MRRRLLSLALGLVLAAGLAAGLLLTGGSPTQAAPSFSLPALGGSGLVTVPVRVHGARLPVVITFFASWCGPCHTELPVVAAEAARFQRAGREVAFVGVDGNDDPASGLAFARQAGVRFPIGSDATSSVAAWFGVQGYPATVFVDATGDVVHVVRGPVSRVALRAWVARIVLAPHGARHAAGTSAALAYSGPPMPRVPSSGLDARSQTAYRFS